ncbi:MAG: tetratricopeptide repeat-containing sulfotransferase family protein [Gemmataceae bacterium]
MHPLMTLALRHHQLGNLDQADVLYQRILQENPQAAEVLHLRGLVAYQCGQPDKAIPHILAAVYLDTNNAAYHNSLGCCYQVLDRLQEAVACFRRALALQPELAEAMSNLGNALNNMGAAVEAEQHCRRALELRPDFPEAFNNLGGALARQGRVVEAAEIFRQALRLNPQFVSAQLNLGHVLQEQGLFTEARQAYEEVLRLEPHHAQAMSSLSLIKRYSLKDQEEIARMEASLRVPNLSVKDRSHLHYALGKAADDAGQYDKAFWHFQQAKQVPHIPFDRRGCMQRIRSLISLFTPERLQAGPFGSTEASPIFIVGMPRSGTTLVEQILASHPEVHGNGELTDIQELVDALPSKLEGKTPYPECVADLLPEDVVKEMAETYLSKRRAQGGNARYFTDKMPTNFLHLGIIAWLFPNARIIHCQRHPLDVCLSCFSTNFSVPPPYVYDLEDQGFFYQRYEELMRHWRHHLPMRILDVSYETLIQHPEPTIRRLLEFCDLSWNDRCLRFHETNRPIQTSSCWQVRQPIYHSSVGRWKHYARHLAPLIQILDPTGECFGLSNPTNLSNPANVFYVGFSR